MRFYGAEQSTTILNEAKSSSKISKKFKMIKFSKVSKISEFS
jgi:hypothetical protein